MRKIRAKRAHFPDGISVMSTDMGNGHSDLSIKNSPDSFIYSAVSYQNHKFTAK